MKGDMQKIREIYGVPAKRFGRVIWLGDDDKGPTQGTITGARYGKLRIRLDGSKFCHTYHPTYCLEYLPEGAK